MILDDGGDATILIHLGHRAEKGDTAFLEKPTNEEEEVLYAAFKGRLKSKPGFYTKCAESIKGVSEETTTGVHRLYNMQKTASCWAGNQRQRFRDEVEVRQPLRLQGIAGSTDPPRHRRHDGWQGRDGCRLR